MNYSARKLLLIALLFEGSILATALLLAGYLGIELTLFPDQFLKDILLGTALAIPPFGLFLLSLSHRAENMPLLGSLRNTVMNEVRALFANARVIDLVLISLLAGFGEELLFRGVIQAKTGIIVASVLFGLVHCISPAYVIVTIIMGFYLGLIYQLTGSLLIVIHLHFIYDLAALIWLRYFVSSGNIEDLTGH